MDSEAQTGVNTAQKTDQYVRSMPVKPEDKKEFTIAEETAKKADGYLNDLRRLQHIDEQYIALRQEEMNKFEERMLAETAIEDLPVDVIPDTAFLDRYLDIKLAETDVQVKVAANRVAGIRIENLFSDNRGLTEDQKKLLRYNTEHIYQTLLGEYEHIEQVVQGSYKGEKRQFCLDKVEQYRRSADAIVTNEAIKSAKEFDKSQAMRLYVREREENGLS